MSGLDGGNFFLFSLSVSLREGSRWKVGICYWNGVVCYVLFFLSFVLSSPKAGLGWRVVGPDVWDGK